jgi:NTP pyrophosphatase (non-canonical NTP hydrolase)
MTRTEHLLTILAEECTEVAQRATKSLRFGLEEVQPGQHLANAERIAGEMADLLGIYALLVKGKLVPQPDEDAVLVKMAKVENYLRYSTECGTLQCTS